MPNIDPSRPCPEAFTPPNGVESADTIPVFIPTMPTSSPSATRMSREASFEKT